VVRLVGHINDELVMILIGAWNSHNFLSQKMVDKTKLQHVETKVSTILLPNVVLGSLIAECSKPQWQGKEVKQEWTLRFGMGCVMIKLLAWNGWHKWTLRLGAMIVQ